MASILIAESGSTKTDWCLIRKTGKAQYFKTSGINPYLQSAEQILLLLTNELDWGKRNAPDKIMFYGAGISSKLQQKKITDVLWQFFKVKNIQAEGDMMAACRALCGFNKGIVSILGTGSNCCYYNGKSIATQQTSLGYIAGDEGSGNHMGKRILQYYAYNTFDTELRMCFEQKFGNDIQAIISRLYSEPFPNRYLASFVPLLRENRGHFMVENIIEDTFDAFFHHHILKIRQSWKLPLYFTGSIANEFKDVLQTLCHQYELEFGKVEKAPIDQLVHFHRKELKHL